MSTAASNMGKNTSYWIHIMITILWMFAFGHLSAPEPITPYGMQILGIFIGLVWGWSFCDLAWPSILSMVALGLSDYGLTSAVFEGAFGQANLIMIMLSFLIFAPLTQNGLSEWLGMKLVTIKMMKGRPLVMVAVIYIGTFVLCLFVNQLIVGIFMMQLFVEIFKKLGYQKGDRFIPMFLAGMFLSTGLSALLFPFRGMPLMVYGMVAKSGIMIDNNTYLLFAALSIVFIVILYIACIKITRCNIALLKDADFSDYEERLETPLSKFQSLLLKVIVAFVAGIVVVGVFGNAKGGVIAQTLNAVGVYGVLAITLVVMMILRVEGEPLLDLKKAASGMNWDFVFLYAMAMLMSSLLVDSSTGISSFIIRYITPLMNGLGEYWFLLLLALVTLILTNIGNNVVVIFTMVSVVSMMVTQGLPINGALAVTVVLWTGLVTGYLLPAASVSAAMIFGCELTTSKCSLMQGVTMMIIWLAALAVFLIPLGMFLL